MAASAQLRICAVACIVLALNAVTTDAALVNRWAFDDSNGLPAPQLLDTGLTGGSPGTFENMTDANRTFDISAEISGGRSLSFDGVDQSITLSPLAAGYASTQDFSLSLWYKGTESRDNANIGYNLLGRNNGDVFVQLSLRGGKVEYVHFGSSNNWEHNIVSTTSVNDDQWHHIAYVNHGSSETGTLYVDGVSENDGNSSVITTAFGSFPFRADSLMAGFNEVLGTGASVFTQGLLDDVRIYSHSLSQAEVTTIFHDSTGTVGPALGDFNSDGHINDVDFGIMKTKWLTVGNAINTNGEVTGDGTVNLFDFKKFKEELYTGPLSALTGEPVPEPNTSVLLLVSSLAWVTLRGRTKCRLASYGLLPRRRS